jgi:DNA replication protein DnaC
MRNDEPPDNIEDFYDHAPEAKLRIASRRLHKRGVPAKDFRRLAGLDALDETSALRIAREWLAGEQTLLVLSGGVGCGKTVAASWAISQDPPPAYGYPGSGDPWPELFWPQFVSAPRLALTNRYDPGEIRVLTGCSVLAIDDLGAEFADKTGSFMATLNVVINSRYDSVLKTIITTNLDAADFTERYGARFADRVNEVGEFVELDDPSLRESR